MKACTTHIQQPFFKGHPVGRIPFPPLLATPSKLLNLSLFDYQILTFCHLSLPQEITKSDQEHFLSAWSRIQLQNLLCLWFQMGGAGGKGKGWARKRNLCQMRVCMLSFYLLFQRWLESPGRRVSRGKVVRGWGGGCSHLAVPAAPTSTPSNRRARSALAAPSCPSPFVLFLATVSSEYLLGLMDKLRVRQKAERSTRPWFL